MDEVLDEAKLAEMPEEEQQRLILELLMRVEDALPSVSHSLFVLLTLTSAANSAISNGVQLPHFLDAAKHIYVDTLGDIKAFAQQQLDEGIEIPDLETTP